jgi:hypothetical protein
VVTVVVAVVVAVPFLGATATSSRTPTCVLTPCLRLPARPVALRHGRRRRVAGVEAGQGGGNRVGAVARRDEEAVDGDGAPEVVGLGEG